MAVKKRVARNSARTKAAIAGRKLARAAKAAASERIARLEATVSKLRASLIAETRRRKLDQRLAADTKKARDAIARQMNAIRAQSAKLASEIRHTMHENRTLDQARKAALATTDELRAKLQEKRDELRRTSAELARLARKSAHRAREIVQNRAVLGAAPPHEESPAAPSESQPKQT